MDAGFLALFKRGRYSRRDDDEKQGCNQTERFTAAVLGFGLRYDTVFRDHFLQTVCGTRTELTGRKVEIWIEPRDSCDLVLWDQNRQELFVIELKLGAELARHQDPAKVEFWQPRPPKGKDGYGFQIIRDYSKLKIRTIYFFTLQNKTSWSKVDKASRSPRYKQFKCEAREWKILRKDKGKESQIEKGIYDFLETQGVSAFIGRKMKRKLRTQEAVGGAHAYNLIKEAVKNYAGDWDEIVWDVSGPGESETYIGVNLDRSVFASTTKLITSRRKVGWLGYDKSLSGGNSCEPSIWLYFSTEDKRRRMDKFAGRHYATSPSDANKMFALRLSPKNAQKDDLSWFHSVIEEIRNYKS